MALRRAARCSTAVCLLLADCSPVALCHPQVGQGREWQAVKPLELNAQGAEGLNISSQLLSRLSLQAHWLQATIVGGIMMRVQRVGHVRPSSGSVSLSESLLLLLMVISSSAGVKAGDPCISLAVRCRVGSKRSKLCVAVQIAYTGGRVHTQSRAKGKSSPGVFTSF